MKRRFIILFCLISTAILSQKKVVKKFETQSKEIEISTLGLDDFVIENSASNFIEITLFAENIEEQHILYKEEFNLVKIQFEIPDNKIEDRVFRKFITKRLHRASAIIKVPKNKVIAVFGDEINVESKSYKGDLKIFIENGILKLHTIYANLQVKMYTGNLYAKLNNGKIDVVSKTGKIKINGILVEKLDQKKEEKLEKEISIHSLNANIFLTTK
ncbi:hypothetical protein [Polaribacter sp. SA4-12]|uniref:hypothetical protein n=1 Tax=Polaribacter sp. SA4-12 TaxID=1312072 RepID=UPI000B3D484D|nr:hypothetical protein [Polaribacter sp. SA4-12]ARV15449.1 hypothetical protein BTO07_09990 [Polaribacter sp. SA4-12]